MAKSVKLRVVSRQLVDLHKDPEGIWTVLVAPLMPGIYGYSFIVDGQSRVDPANLEINPEREPDDSELDVTSNPPQLTQCQEVEHGTIHLHDHFSFPLIHLRHLRV